MKNYLSEAQERAKLIWKTEAEQEAFIRGVQWLIMQPEIVKLLDFHNVNCRVFMRNQATNIFELTKGFTTETKDNGMKAALEMAGYVQELTAHDYLIHGG